MPTPIDTNNTNKTANNVKLAGFVVGIVEKSKIIHSTVIEEGDILIALPSSGLHTHGFSVINTLIEHYKIDLQQSFGVQTLGEALLMPSRIYVKSLLPLLQEGLISACVPITKGGVTENLTRLLPKGVDAIIDLSTLELSSLYEWIQQTSKLETSDMLGIFNCGIGMILVVGKEKIDEVMARLRSAGEQPWILGFIESSSSETPSVHYEIP